MKTTKVTTALLCLILAWFTCFNNLSDAMGSRPDGKGDSLKTGSTINAPVLTAYPLVFCEGTQPTLVASVTGIRALVVWSDFNDGGITSYLSSDPRFTLVTSWDARSTTPPLQEMLKYDVVITWSVLSYEIFNSPGPIYNNITIGDNLKEYVDNGGGVLVCNLSHDISTNLYGGIGGAFRASQYDPIIADDSQAGGGTTGIGSISIPSHPFLEGVTDVNINYFYTTTQLSSGAVPVFYLQDGSIGGATKTIGNGNVASLNLVPTYSYSGGADMMQLVANGAAWAAFNVDWYSDYCGGTSIGRGKYLQVAPSSNATYYAQVTNLDGEVSLCSDVTVTLSNENCFENNPTCTYVVLAKKLVHMEGCTVNSGGVGATKTVDGKVEAKANTHITASGTFVKAALITVDAGSQVTERYYSPATVDLPVFEHNPYNASNNVSIPGNQTVTLNGSIYREVKVGKNATVIFTQPDIYCLKIIMEDGADVNFTQDAKVHLLDGIPGGNNITINQAGMNVVFYIEQDVEFKEGANVTGVFYLGALDHGASKLKYRLTIRESKITHPGVYTGMFLAENIDARKNNSFSLLQNVSFCASATRNYVSIEDVASEKQAIIRNYPNPFSENTTIAFSFPADDHVILQVYDVSGKMVRTLFSGDVNAQTEYKAEFDGSALPAGLYFYRMITNNEIYSGKMILEKE